MKKKRTLLITGFLLCNGITAQTWQPLEDQRLSTTNSPTFANVITVQDYRYPQIIFKNTTTNTSRILFSDGNDAGLLKYRHDGINDVVLWHSGNFNPSSKLDFVYNGSLDGSRSLEQSAAGKIFNATNYPVPYGMFMDIGAGIYKMQFNAAHTRNGNIYVKVSGDGGEGDWQTLYHSGNLNRPVTMQNHHIGNDVNMTADQLPANSTTFAYTTGTYSSGTPFEGPLASLGGLDGRYELQLNASYTLGTGLAFRTRNGDGNGQWNSWNYVYHSGNFNPAGYLPLSGGTVTGELNVGSTDNQKNLAVNGEIKTRKIRVTQTGWPDYVFDSSYQLKPLHQIEKFIAANKHLPDVPSAATVTKEGVDLGDNQVVLLKKIEELTLYIIEQNKRVEYLEQEMQKMKAAHKQ